MTPDWVKDYVGLPYSEVDCWGLVCKIYAEQWDIFLGKPEDQKAANHGGCWDISTDHDLGNLVLFKENELGRHVGFIIDSQFMLHSNEGSDSCIERWNRFMWKDRVIRIYRCSLLQL